MKSAVTIRTFRRSDNRKIVRMNERIEGEDAYIDELQRNRMVREVRVLDGAPENKGNPTEAATELLSASPAAPASPQTTVSESESGEAKPKRGRPRKVEVSS